MGLCTGEVTRVYGGNGGLLASAVYYDERGNVVQQHSQNHQGGYEHFYYHLTFTGKPLKIKHIHSANDTINSDIERYSYDSMERQLTISYDHNGAGAVLLSSNAYDSLGRLAASNLNGGGCKIAYAYNVRGWTKGVAASVGATTVFSQTLHYEDAPSGGTPCWDGNISGVSWRQREGMKATTPTQNQYLFTYDALDRLTRADYSSDGEQWNGDLLTMGDRDFSCAYTYDLNGKLERTLTDGGYIQDGKHYFYIKDYQGNVRAVLNQQNQPVELTSYYPYGGIIAATAAEGVQPYKYGGKELDRENGLDWYDSRARYYDPLLGRTPTQDPKAESYPHLTPYLWCAANPINFTDPSGMVIEDPNKIVESSIGYIVGTFCSLKNNTLFQQNETERYNYVIAILYSKIKEYGTLKNSDQIYRIELDSQIDKGTAYTNYDPSTGKVITHINADANIYRVALFAHESEHWSQFENGDLSFVEQTGDAGFMYDINDEIKAYNIQSIIEDGVKNCKSYNQRNIPDVEVYRTLVNEARKNMIGNIYRIETSNGSKITIRPNK